MKRKSHLRFYTNLFLTSAFAIGGSYSLAKSALAQAVPIPLTPAGTFIDNKATGSFVGDTSNTPGTVESNTVRLSVLEVTGIGVVAFATTEASATPTAANANSGFNIWNTLTPGPYQGVEGINKGDIVFFDFTITNTGNSPTAFFIPNTATVTGGTQRGIRVIAVDPDGSKVGAETPLSVPVPTTTTLADRITTATNFLGATNGYIPIGGTVTVRVAVEITGVQVGEKTTVVLGSTVATNTYGSNGQNEDYVASGTDRDVYTSDLADNTTIPTAYNSVATIDKTAETAGEPVNGTLTPTTAGAPRKEAADNAFTEITAGIDYGDAPTSYTTSLAFTIGAGYSNSGASHIIDNLIKIGATAVLTDAEADGQPNATATGDAAGVDDENGVNLPAFNVNSPIAIDYTATLTSVINNTGSPAYLVGWIDLNRNGVFEASEARVYDFNTNDAAITPIPTGSTLTNVPLTWNIPTGLSAGDRFARFRLTTDIGVIGGNVTTPAPQPFTPLGKGEVEDYILGKVPGFNLVKRITAITDMAPTTPVTTQITGFENQAADVVGNNDSDTKWPSASSQYLRGAINCTTAAPCNSGAVSGAKPGDLVEYTIYFLSNGSDNVKNVQLCDRIPTNTTFELNTYGTDNGVLFGWDNTLAALPNPADSTVAGNKVAINNASAFVAAAPLPITPTNPCNGASNPNGAVLFNIGASTIVPAATGTGTPINSYGFIRFKVKVK